MALALTEPGADRNVAGIETTAQTIRRLGREALPTAGDLIDTDQIDHVFATMDD